MGVGTLLTLSVGKIYTVLDRHHYDQAGSLAVLNCVLPASALFDLCVAITSSVFDGDER